MLNLSQIYRMVIFVSLMKPLIVPECWLTPTQREHLVFVVRYAYLSNEKNRIVFGMDYFLYSGRLFLIWSSVVTSINFA